MPLNLAESEHIRYECYPVVVVVVNSCAVTSEAVRQTRQAIHRAAVIAHCTLAEIRMRRRY
jgi:tRNA A37 methylthiotransferase MiaB